MFARIPRLFQKYRLDVHDYPPNAFYFLSLVYKKNSILLIGKPCCPLLVFRLIGLNHSSVISHREVHPVGYYVWKSQTRRGVVNVTPMSHPHPSPQVAFHSLSQLHPSFGAHPTTWFHDKSHMSYFFKLPIPEPSPELLELASPGVGPRNICIHKQWLSWQVWESRLRSLVPSVKFYGFLSH